MTNELQQESPATPPELDEFIDRIDWHDEKNKQHLRDIIEMVREGALDKWKAKYAAHVAWHRDKRAGEQDRYESLPEELKSEEGPSVRVDYPDEYYWLESAVSLGLEEGYLSEKDEARTRLLLARAMKT